MDNTHVLITGAGQRLGLHCVETLLAQGYQVSMTYRTRHPSVAQLEARKVQCVYGDFSNTDGIVQFIDTATQELRNVNVIIHNASAWISENTLDTDSATLASLFDEMMNVHVKAPYLINFALREHYRDSLQHIIHISDFAAAVGSCKHAAYAASKAALDNLTLSLARMWAPAIRVNSIAPALLMFNDWDDASYRTAALSKSLLGIEPGPECFSDTVQYLLQNPYLTGQIIGLNGGRHLNLL